MSVLDFLRDVGKHFPVNRMLARDVVRNRLDDGISYTEFSYVLLQSMDYLELFRSYGCTLQFGGSDQWGNITAGVELVRRAEGARVHALATPLLTKSDGTKFGKTESGTVWLDPAMTSPYAFHQFFLNAEDAKVVEYLKVFTARSQAEIADLERQTAEQPHLRAAQKALADDVTALVHSSRARRGGSCRGGALRPRRIFADLQGGVAGRRGGGGGGVEVPRGRGAVGRRRVGAQRRGGRGGAARRAIAEGGGTSTTRRVADPEARAEPPHSCCTAATPNCVAASGRSGPLPFRPEMTAGPAAARNGRVRPGRASV